MRGFRLVIFPFQSFLSNLPIKYFNSCFAQSFARPTERAIFKVWGPVTTSFERGRMGEGGLFIYRIFFFRFYSYEQQILKYLLLRQGKFVCSLFVAV